MPPSARELSALIGAVYEAGLDPTGAGWPAALERLSPVIAGDGAVVLGLEHRRFEYSHTHFARTDLDSVARYQAYYGRIDPVFEPALPEAPSGALLLSDALMAGPAPAPSLVEWGRRRSCQRPAPLSAPRGPLPWRRGGGARP